MGARLVKLAYAFAADVPLNPNEFRLLGYMALTALDEDPTPRYFDSRESSALALGRRVVDAGYGDEADAKHRAAAFESVKVALRGLVAVGAISRAKTGRAGQRAEYALHLNATLSRSKPEVIKRRSGEGSPFPTRKAHPSPLGRLTLPQQEGSPFPQGTTTGTTKEPDRGITLLNGTTSLAPVDNSLGVKA